MTKPGEGWGRTAGQGGGRPAKKRMEFYGRPRNHHEKLIAAWKNAVVTEKRDSGNPEPKSSTDWGSREGGSGNMGEQRGGA